MISPSTDHNLSGTRVVHVRECNSVFRSNRMPNDNFIHIIKFIPVFLLFSRNVTIERFKLGPSWNGDVEGLGRQKLRKLKEMFVVGVQQVRRYQWSGKTVEARHDRSGQSPSFVRWTVGISSSGNTKSDEFIVSAMSTAPAAIFAIIILIIFAVFVFKIVIIHRFRQWLIFVQPTRHKSLDIIQTVLVLVVVFIPKLHSNWLRRLHIQDVIGVI
mmetsp:Transcript_5921/g.12958  ORF Transcript_5921/g.12958 Transcript_5921/m.12958 type:complete len:214 (+) Transcript_5921:6491-7132(+)